MPQAVIAYLPLAIMAAQLGYTLASGMASRGETRRREAGSGSGHLITGQSTRDPIRLIYGTHKTGGTRVFFEGSGQSGNQYYEQVHIIQTWCEGEVESLEELFCDDKPAANFAGWYYHEFHPGSPTQGVSAGLKSYFPDWDDAMRDTAYSYIRLLYNANLFTSLPEFRAVIKGLKVLDPRTSTVAWSENPGCCLYDLHRNRRYGVGLGDEWWDEDWVVDFCNWCDAKGYKMNACLYTREMALDLAAKLAASFRALPPVWSDGLFGFRGLDYDAPVMDLTEDDIVEGSFKFGIPDLVDFPTSIQVKYYNKDNGYIFEDLKKPNKTSVDFLGDEVTSEIQLIGCAEFEQAAKVLAYELDRSQVDKYFYFVAGQKAVPLEQGDIIRVTHSLPGWDQHVVRIEAKQDLPEGEVALTVKEETEELYDDDIDLSIRESITTNLPDPLAIPPPPADVNFSEESYSIKDNSYSRLKISWTTPENYPFLDYVEIWISRDGGANYFHHADSVGSVTIDNLKDGEELYIKLRAVSINGRREDLANLAAYQYTVVGKDTVPDNVTGFQATAAGDTVLLRWDEGDMKDLAGYEIRYGASWGSSIYFGFTRGQTFSMVGVKPGVHSFSIKRKDTVGNYSATAAVATVTVFNPPGYSEVNSATVDYETEGTHNKTEYYNDPVHGDSLRVASPNLSGDYTSPVYDLGSKQPCRHWLNYELNITATGATWEGGFGNVNWEEVISSGETWIQQLANVQAGTFRAKFFYSDDGTNWNEVDHFEILSVEVDARYIKYQIVIENNDAASSIMVEPAVLKSWWR